ncbi:hypothetical protein [Candidatus Binatus sp.]|uniref:hypothetical protein n=1 Tax=Candidatus Binatus sp. TaxID=2811406 RepID=UPI002F95642D
MAALLFTSRRKDAGFSVAAFCFDLPRGAGGGYASATLLHLDAQGRWEAEKDAWLVGHPDASPEYRMSIGPRAYGLNRPKAYNLEGWPLGVARLFAEAGYSRETIVEIINGRQAMPSDAEIFSRIARHRAECTLLRDGDSNMHSPNHWKFLDAVMRKGMFSHGSWFETCEQEHNALMDHRQFTGFSAEVWMALALCHCKNVRLVEEHVPEKKQRQYQKQNRPAIQKFYTLEIDPMREILRRTLEGEAKGSAMRALHICRGHFKTYDESAPMFGKITGSFWWAQQLRGNSQRGRINKDYAV